MNDQESLNGLNSVREVTTPQKMLYPVPQEESKQSRNQHKMHQSSSQKNLSLMSLKGSQKILEQDRSQTKFATKHFDWGESNN
jgi:hypothetical protein